MPPTPRTKKPNAPKKSMVSKTPLAINTRSKNTAPRVQQNASGTSVSHREILSENAIASISYNVSGTFAVQPALAVYSHGSPLGTWLPKIAAEYDNYVFEKLKIHYVTSASSLQKGTIFMAYDPNPESAAPSSFSDLRNMANAVTGPARENLVLDISSVVRQKKLLTRSRAVSSYPPYDAGRLFLGATLGDDQTVGYFEVEYTVRLSNPQTSPSNEVISISSVPPSYLRSSLDLADNTAYAFGTSNSVRNAFGFSRYLSTGATYGDTALLTPSNLNASASGTIVRSGVTYSWVNAAPITLFRPNFLGRYEVRGCINGDFDDYATFGGSILRFNSTGTSHALDAIDITISTAGLTLQMPVIPFGGRGFSNPTTGADDFGISFEQTFAVTSPSEYYALALGVRNNTGISQNGDAYISFNNTTSGFSFLKFTYLGPLPI